MPPHDHSAPGEGGVCVCFLVTTVPMGREAWCVFASGRPQCPWGGGLVRVSGKARQHHASSTCRAAILCPRSSMQDLRQSDQPTSYSCQVPCVCHKDTVRRGGGGFLPAGEPSAERLREDGEAASPLTPPQGPGPGDWASGQSKRWHGDPGSHPASTRRQPPQFQQPVCGPFWICHNATIATLCLLHWVHCSPLSNAGWGGGANGAVHRLPRHRSAAQAGHAGLRCGQRPRR